MMSNEEIEKDCRQINLMKSRLELYKSGQIDLHTFIAELSFLMEHLSPRKGRLKKRLFREWMELEVLYATILSRLENAQKGFGKLRAELGKADAQKVIDASIGNIVHILSSEP